MNINHYNYRVIWSSDDNEHVGLCVEFPSLSWLAPSPEKALSGIRKVVADTVEEMTASGESVSEALSKKIQWAIYGSHTRYDSPNACNRSRRTRCEH